MGLGGLMLGRGYISHHSEYALSSSLSIYITLIAIVLSEYNAAFLSVWLKSNLSLALVYRHINEREQVRGLILIRLLSYATVDFYLFYDGAAYMQIWTLLTRSQSRVSDTQVTIKTLGPLVNFLSRTTKPNSD